MIFLFLSLFQLWLWNGNQIPPVQNGFSDEMKGNCLDSYILPRERRGLATRDARFGADAGRYSTVSDFHRLLLASLPAAHKDSNLGPAD